MARNYWEPGVRKKAFYKERARHDRAPEKEIDMKQANKLVAAFKKKAVARLKIFYAESQLMDKKVTAMIEKAESLGYYIDKLELNSVDEEYILNYRKRTKGIALEIKGHRDHYQFTGKLTITPASMLLRMNCPDLRRIYTKGGYALDHFRINYYRTMNISDNYLAGVVREQMGAATETVEVPF
jgi:hypothetical protein